MSNTIVAYCPSSCEVFSMAKTMPASQRQSMALKVLEKSESVSGLAQKGGVSRKFLYQQARKAQKSLDDAFVSKPDDEKVLFYLPITKEWLRQFVLVLALCRLSVFCSAMLPFEVLCKQRRRCWIRTCH